MIKPVENVPIVSGGTTWADPLTGMKYILVFNESLYYGTKLDHSLINPNQVRHYGIEFWDNPFDKDKGLKIELDEVLIRMKSEGTKVFFESSAPTDVELPERGFSYRACDEEMYKPQLLLTLLKIISLYQWYISSIDIVYLIDSYILIIVKQLH